MRRVEPGGPNEKRPLIQRKLAPRGRCWAKGTALHLSFWTLRPCTVHAHAHYRVWQRRFYDVNLWSEKERLEKLNYLHGNPVKRRLVSSPEHWPWSSVRFYYRQDASLLALDPMP